jgi:raffinose/stachyose/melibiose transport system substrate-binding protein
MTTPHLSRRSFLGLTGGVAAGAVLLAACGSEAPPAADGPQEFDWWHIQNGEPLKPVWAAIAQEYMTAHSNVKINITDRENEAFKAALTTATQAGNPPDLFQSWGGGVLKQQVEAGLVKDITDDVSSWVGNLSQIALEPYKVDGRIYGIPWDSGMVGFWYNKDLFAQAGITGAPATWPDLLAAVDKLKAAGITPIALAGKDKWPAHFYWSYLAIRIAGVDALKTAEGDGNFNKPEFVQAGAEFKKLIDKQPFQTGFLGAGYGDPDGQAAAVGNGQAAMELMGQWAPAVQASASTSTTGLGDKLAFFPFPSVPGGKGKGTDIFGGGNGFAVGKDAPPATLDFLKYFLDVAQQRRAAATGAIIPTTKGAEDAIKDANAKIVAQTFNQATGYQLYLDQYFPPAVGTQVNDSVAELVAGTKSPEQVTQDITAAAGN